MELRGFTPAVRLIADSVEVEKDGDGRIGIAIGGGAPHCACLYVVDVFHGGAVAADGRLQVGDELLAVNGIGVKGQDKVRVASLIRQAPSPIRLSVNRLQLDAETERLPTLDILLKKLKHRFVESVDPEVADALGLSRAILSNDLMGRMTQKLNANIQFYRELIKRADEMRALYAEWGALQQRLAMALVDVANREELTEALSDGGGEQRCMLNAVAECHREWAREQEALAGKLAQFADELRVFSQKAIPDTQLSLRKYANTKHTYLSFCLKVKEMEDEEVEKISHGGELPRLAAGNIDYRVALRCREQAREKFIEQRKHAMIKMELLEEKHVMELALQLKKVLEALANNHIRCRDLVRRALQNISSRPTTAPVNVQQHE